MNGAPYSCSIVWLRRDLRLNDNVAIEAAANRSQRVVIAFVLDPELLKSVRIGAPIVHAFFSGIDALRADLRRLGSDLALLEGDCGSEILELAAAVGAKAVFYNEDYEPVAIRRDERAARLFEERGLTVHVSRDHVYFGAEQIVQAGGASYRVFTPYKRRWLEHFATSRLLPLPSLAAVTGKLVTREDLPSTRATPLSEDFGYASSRQFPTVSEKSALEKLRRFLSGPLQNYARDRDFPAMGGTSHLSTDLRAGAIGIRSCVEGAYQAGGAETWISELIWRDFYQMILRTFPNVADAPFIGAASRIPWRNAPRDLQSWCEGRTGYPIIDAAMLQLNTLGWMHNRLRMVVASFLSKHLLIDWRQGERYFEQHLADADLAANNGGWQWSASTGTDALPYFRIFNPVLQSQRFDPEGRFIRSMLPQFENVPDPVVHEPWKYPGAVADYPPPIVDHAYARQRALAAYSVLKRP